MAVLTLNRPQKCNALSRALREEIVERLDALEQSEAIRAVVLTGAGRPPPEPGRSRDPAARLHLAPVAFPAAGSGRDGW